MPNIIQTKFHQFRAQLPYLPRSLALVWTAARGWALTWSLLLVMQGFVPMGTVFLTRHLVDSLVEGLNTSDAWSHIRPTLGPLILMAGLLLLAECLRSLSRWVRTALTELAQAHINTLIHHKSMTVDFAFYESSDYYDRLHHARAEATHCPVALLENLGNLCQHSLTLAVMAVILLPFGPWLPLVLLLTSWPALYVALRSSLQQHRWHQQTATEERRSVYYDWLLTTGDAAAEVRVFALGEHVQSLYQALRRRLIRGRLRLAKAQSLREFVAGGIALLLTSATLAWMVWRALQGHVTLGEVALFYQAFTQGQRLMRTLLEQVGHAYRNILFLGDLFAFLDLEPRLQSPGVSASLCRALHRGIAFHQVSFCYPGSQHAALHDFNLTIPAHQIVAIVGANGAGKSTLIKLLCRLYDPDAGRIELDGVDLRDISFEELRRSMTVLFQQPVSYQATAAENIRFGDVSAPIDLAAIEAAAQAAGADAPIARLPAGYHTPLGKWFADGVELSVGEWQRLALARTILRRAPILLLDEPTSAMDPWSEAEWIEHFRTVATGRTAVIITHRVSTAMRADAIHVMHGGQIVESGSHDELLAVGGRYARAWALHGTAIAPATL